MQRMRKVIILFLSGIFIWAGCTKHTDNYEAVLPSPDSGIRLYFNLFKGNPYYLVFRGRERILNWSLLGFTPPGGPSLAENMLFDGREEESVSSGATMKDFFKDIKYNSLSVRLASGLDPDNGYTIDFRAFEEGFAFRYRFDQSLEKSKLEAFEYSEMSLNDQDRTWRPLPAPDIAEDSLNPGNGNAGFESDSSLVIHVRELKEGNLLDPHIVEGTTPSSYVIGNGGIVGGDHDSDGNTATPWRIVIFTNTNKDEQ